MLQGILVLFAYAWKCLLGSSGIIIRHKDLFKVHRRVGGINFVRIMLRYEVNAPDVLVIFIAFKEDRVQIVVNIFLEFLIILFLDTSEMKMDILQMKYGWNIIINISEGTYDPQWLFQRGTFFFQFGLFLLELIRLGADLLYCGKCCFNTRAFVGSGRRSFQLLINGIDGI